MALCDWSLGGMSAVQPRDLEIPLGFFGKSSFDAKIWKDGSDTGKGTRTTLSIPVPASIWELNSGFIWPPMVGLLPNCPRRDRRIAASCITWKETIV